VRYDRTAVRGARAWHVHCDEAPNPAQPGAQDPEAATAAAGYRPVDGERFAINDRGTRVHWFDSIASYRACGETSRHGINAHQTARSLEPTGEYWWGKGIENCAQARATFDSGIYPAGAELIRDHLSALECPELAPVQIRRRAKRGDFGDEVDIHAVNAGAIDTAWRRMGRQALPGNAVITLAVNGSISAGTDAMELFWRAAAILKLADLLSSRGYSVRLAWLDATEGLYMSGNAQNRVDVVTVKDAHAPLDMQAMALALACPSMLRLCEFSAAAAVQERLSQGFGVPGRVAGLCNEATDVFAGSPGMTLDGGAVNSADTAKAWIVATLAELVDEAIEAA
jgi:hypothetical protein